MNLTSWRSASFPLKKIFPALSAVCAIALAICLLTLSPPAHAEQGGNANCATPPVSTITSPLAGAQIGGVTTYTITGTASSAGTGVLKVKVSTNGGKSWHLATDTSGDSSWASWSFTWKMASNKADNDGDIDPDEKKVVKDGSYVILSRAKSNPGCVETVGPGVTVTVDNTEPVTAAHADGYVFGSVTATSPVSVTLSTSDGAGSGVAAGSPKYCVDTANTCTPNLAYSAAVNVACAPGSACTQYVRYHSLDRVGNSEVVQSSIIRQNPPDLQPPTTVASAAGYTFENWTGTSPMRVTLSASDVGTGIAAGYPKYCIDAVNTCAPDSSYTEAINITCAAGANCTQYVRYQSVDNSGNVEPVRTSVVKQDLQSPVVSASPTGGRIGGSAAVSLSCDDGTGSGCSTIYYTTDGSTPTANSFAYAGPISISKTTSVKFLAVDNAGNSAAVQSADYITTYSVTAGTDAHGSITCTPTVVDYDSSSACTIIPGAGYRVTDVTVGPTNGASIPVGAVALYNITNIKADMTISAAFAINTFTVTPSAGPGGGITPDTAQSVDYNGRATLTVTPDAGHHVAAVTGCNGTLSDNIFTTGPITSNCTVAAEFAINTFTISANAGMNGSVSCSPAIVPYNSGSVCTITADAGYHMTITGCNGTLTGNSYAISAVQSDCTIFATFTNSAPSLPAIVAPLSETETTTLSPTLVVNAATDPDGDAVMYTFEIFSDGGLSTLVTGTTTESANWTTPALSNNTRYYWRAQASDGHMNSNWVTTANFFVNTVNNRPSDPGISAPVNNVHVSTLTPALSVTNAADVDYYDTLSYDFDVAADGQFTNIVASATSVAQSAGGATSWIVTPALSENTPYFWRVRAKDNNGETSNFVSASFFINTANDAPTAPVVNTPAAGGEVAVSAPVLVVTDATDPDSQTLMYTFELDTVNTFDSSNKQSSGLTAEGAGTTGWTPAALTENATYYWRAKANDGLADGPWMATAKFFVNTVNEAPSVPTLNNPAAGAWVTVLAPTLQVNASTDSDGDNLTYEYEVFSDSGLSTSVTSATAGNSWVIPMNLSDNTRYWWRAQAKDEHGAASGWMAESSFFVNDKGYNDPPSISITRPGASESTNGTKFLITWTASDPDSDPVITLFYNTTGSGFNGTPIATGMHLSDPVSSYDWDISGLADGAYYVYARIDDGNTAASTYAAGPLVIDRTPHTPVITASAGPNGGISPSGAITVQNGASQNFFFTPDAGYRVLDVVVDGVSIGARDAYGFLNVGANHTISVTFTPDVYTITATADSNGSISPAGVTEVSKGGSQTYTITPNQGYTVSYVTVDGQNKGPITSFEFTNVRTNHTITAYFTVITHTITASAGPHGSIVQSGSVSVPNGGSRAFDITAEAGYHIEAVFVDGASVGAVARYDFSNVTAAHTILATFAPNESKTITATTSGLHGSISPAGDVSVLGGASQTFTFTPEAGFRVFDVVVDSVSKGAMTSYTFTNVQSNHTINVTFTLNVYTVTATAGGNGSITPVGPTTVQPGGSQTYTIMPAAGYEVENVVVDGVSKGAITTYTFSSIAADHTISASFRLFGYTITASAGSHGSISPSGSVFVPDGLDQTFTITPATGYHVSDILVDGASAGAVTSYTFTSVAAAHTISATFAQNPPSTITATAGQGGGISPSGAVSVPNGANQYFFFTPAAGYRVLDVVVDNVSQGARDAWGFSNVVADHTISVTFTLDVYTITATADSNGRILPPGETVVNKGESQTYEIIPDPGYSVSYVTVDGAYKGPITSFTFTNVRTNHGITAYFTVATHTITASAGPNGSIAQSGSGSVTNGGSRSVTFTADAGYHVSAVLVDGAPVSDVTSDTFSYTYNFVNVTASHTISATFAENTAFFITALDDMDFDGMHGSISPAGVSPDYVIRVLGGASQTFLFTPAAGYRVQDVFVDGVSVGAMTSYTFTNVQSDHTIDVDFTLNVYTITATAGANGSMSLPPATTVQPGESLTCTITPNAGYEVENVVVDGVSKGAITTYTFESIAADHTISVSFKEFVFGYMITSSAGPNGSISPSESVPAGTNKTFTITPATGYHVVDVLVDGVSVGAVTSYTFTNVDATHTISATFALNTSFTITASAGPNGSISPPGVTNVSNGGSQTYTFTPLDERYIVGGVIVDNMNIGKPASYTFTNVSSNHVITVYFEDNPDWFE